MGKDASMKLPREEELSWGLTCGEAVLGRSTTYREGGGGSGAQDYERRITDRRFGGRYLAGEVTRARRFRARWRQLAAEHRDVLALAYGVTLDVYRADVAGRKVENQIGRGKRRRIETVFVPGAFDLRTWQALERAFGPLVGVALLLDDDAPDEIAPQRRRFDGEKCGAWRTPKALRLVALVLGTDKASKAGLEAHQQRCVAALTDAMEAWWAISDRKVA